MTKAELTNTIGRTFSKASLQLRKHSPELLVGAGIVGVIGSTILACKATTKISGIVDEHKEHVEAVHHAVERISDGDTIMHEDGSQYTLEDSKKDLTIIYAQTSLKLVKLYAPAVLLGAASIAAIVASNRILNGRNAALAAAYVAVDKGFKDYRGRVIERFGEQLDKELRFNVKTKDVEEVVVDEKGKEKVVKNTVTVAEPNLCSDYAKFFDETCAGWKRDAEYNLMFLRHQQQYANDRLKAEGYLFLNDVYESIGIPRTKAGQVVGWVYDPKHPNGDNYIDFGIYDKPEFVNGHEKSILLDFNVDGPILDLI